MSQSFWRLFQGNHGAQMSQMFERCLDAEVVTLEILSEDYSKVPFLSRADEQMDATNVYLASHENSLYAAVLRMDPGGQKWPT